MTSSFYLSMCYVINFSLDYMGGLFLASDRLDMFEGFNPKIILERISI